MVFTAASMSAAPGVRPVGHCATAQLCHLPAGGGRSSALLPRQHQMRAPYLAPGQAARSCRAAAAAPACSTATPAQQEAHGLVPAVPASRADPAVLLQRQQQAEQRRAEGRATSAQPAAEAPATREGGASTSGRQAEDESPTGAQPARDQAVRQLQLLREARLRSQSVLARLRENQAAAAATAQLGTLPPVHATSAAAGSAHAGGASAEGAVAVPQASAAEEESSAGNPEEDRSAVVPAAPPLPSAAQLTKGSRLVDRAMYDQLAASRNRLSARLSSQTQYIRYLEDAVAQRSDDLVAMHEALVALGAEVNSLGRLAHTAAAAAAYSTDPDKALDKMVTLCERVALLQEVVADTAAQLDASCVREVPVAWYGCASEVRVAGDFDNWTAGLDLSTHDYSDSVFTRFEGTLRLLPGEYRIKFVVDGEWRLAGDWPTETDEQGDTNNLLVVE